MDLDEQSLPYRMTSYKQPYSYDYSSLLMIVLFHSSCYPQTSSEQYFSLILFDALVRIRTQLAIEMRT